MPEVRSLGYIVIESSAPEKWRDYGLQVLGMMPAPQPPEDQGVYLKMDPHPWRLAIVPGKQDRYLLAGWELVDARALDEACEVLQKAKVPFKKGSDEEADQRGVIELVRLEDPSGNALELFHGRGLDYVPFVSPLAVSRFETGPDGNLGLGHVVLCAEHLVETRQFYRELLGFDDSDHMEVPNPQGGANAINFLHCANPRHHSLALYGVPAAAFPAGCVHIMVEVDNVDEVGACLDRVNEREIHIFSTLGRHSNDHMLSFYMMTPTGFALEYGCQGRQLDWRHFTPTVTAGRGSIWGHHFNLPDMPDSG